MKNIIYISYTGVMEPLGRSQVLNYVLPLSEKYKIKLISFEKKEDWSNKDVLERELNSHGVVWAPQKYRRNYKVIFVFLSFFKIFFLLAKEAMSEGVSLIHCRSYMPTLAVWFSRKIIKKPYVFDMRALWVDEKKMGRKLKADSILCKCLERIEYFLLRDAKVIISLTESAVQYLITKYPALPKEKFQVITTCVDLDKFQPVDKSLYLGRKFLTIGSIGSVLSDWFNLELMLKFFYFISLKEPTAKFKIVTRDDSTTIRKKAIKHGLSSHKISIISCTPEEVPKMMEDISAVAMFFYPGVGKLGSSPTRMGECLARGIPVVVNSGVGDVSSLIGKYKVGVVLDGFSKMEMEKGILSLMALLDDDNTPNNCRFSAEDYFSLRKGLSHYDKIYEGIVKLEDNRSFI